MLRSSGDLAYTRRSFVTSGKVTARGDLEAGQKGWSCSGSPGRERSSRCLCRTHRKGEGAKVRLQVLRHPEPKLLIGSGVPGSVPASVHRVPPCR